jgi:hypothetical protein
MADAAARTAPAVAPMLTVIAMDAEASLTPMAAAASAPDAASVAVRFAVRRASVLTLTLAARSALRFRVRVAVAEMLTVAGRAAPRIRTANGVSASATISAKALSAACASRIAFG